MAGRRTLRVAREIKEFVSPILIHELSDPRMAFITVTEVDVAPDMRTAVVKLSILGEPKQIRDCLQAVQRAQSRIQKGLFAHLHIKTVPKLSFAIDDSVKKSVEISRLIRLGLQEDQARRPETGDEASAAPQSPESSELPAAAQAKDQADSEAAEADEEFEEDVDEEEVSSGSRSRHTGKSETSKKQKKEKPGPKESGGRPEGFDVEDEIEDDDFKDDDDLDDDEADDELEDDLEFEDDDLDDDFKLDEDEEEEEEEGGRDR